MEWHSFPDSSYVPDNANAFVRDRGLRRKVITLSVFRSIVALLLVLGALFLWFMTGVIGRWDPLASGVAIVMFIVLLLVIEKIPGVRRLSGKDIALSCSGCSGKMETVTGRGASKNVIFCICRKCRRYVDTGLRNGD